MQLAPNGVQQFKPLEGDDLPAVPGGWIRVQPEQIHEQLCPGRSRYDVVLYYNDRKRSNYTYRPDRVVLNADLSILGNDE